MLLSAVSVLVDAQSSSEIAEGLMNNPVLNFYVVFEYCVVGLMMACLDRNTWLFLNTRNFV